MRDSRTAMVARIRRLRPVRVLAIGVGTGLLLSQLAPDCAEYWATDFSSPAIAALRAGVAGRSWAVGEFGADGRRGDGLPEAISTR